MEKKSQSTSGVSYPQKVFAHQLITVDDLAHFKRELLSELVGVPKTQSGITTQNG